MQNSVVEQTPIIPLEFINNPVRKAFVRLLSWKWFEKISLIVILINCLTLSLADPCETECRSMRCKVLQIMEHGIFIFFTLEMGIKMIGLGIWGSKYSYLADNWNRFDCLIVIIGTLEYIFATRGLNFTVIRSIRVIRTLRAIKRISSLRILVTLMIDIMPMLGNVLIFAGFLFFIFGIVAVQLWAGVLRQRCFFPKLESFNASEEKPPDFMPPFYMPINSDYVCSTSFSSLTCDEIPSHEKEISMCEKVFRKDGKELAACHKWVVHYTECRPDEANPAWGYINFDNIGFASIAIFQVISLEGWSNIMYLVQDAYSYWMWIYFVLLVLLGSYLTVNLCLVIIAAQFTVTKATDRKRNLTIKSVSSPSSLNPTDSSASTASSGLYSQIFNMLLHYVAICLKTITAGKLCAVPQSRRSFLRNYFYYCKSCGYQTVYNPLTTVCPVCENVLKQMRPKWWTIAGNRFFLRQAFEDDAAVVVVMSGIVINAVAMAMEHYGQGMEVTIMIECVNMAFTIIFLAEFSLKCYAYGPHQYFSEGFNTLDTIIIAINVVEVFSSNKEISGLSVLRLFRLLRLVRIIRFVPKLQHQIMVMLQAVDNVASFFFLLTFFLYIFSLLGLNLFGCKLCEPIKGKNPEKNGCNIKVLRLDDQPTPNVHNEVQSVECLGLFDTILHSLFTVLQVVTQDNWAVVMYDGMRYTSEWASIYFIALATFGNYIVFNLLMAILVEAFNNNSNDYRNNKSHNDDMSMSSSMLRRLNRPIRRRLIKPIIIVTDQSQPHKLCKLKLDKTKFRIVQFIAALKCSNHSLFIFDHHGKIRRLLRRILGSRLYKRAFLILIVANCLLIMAERPAISRNSLENRIIIIGNYFFTCVFSVEAVCKMIAMGFFIGPKSYLRSGWNAIDFFLVCISAIYIIVEQASKTYKHYLVIEFFQVLCLLRALRPLRLASHSPGLRVMIQALLLSIKPISTILFICCFFFVIFSILGVQLFSGCFAECSIPEANLTMSTVSTIRTKADCLAFGFNWQKESLNFDNLLNALVTLFVFSTLDGWTSITLSGVACSGVDKQPTRGSNPFAYGYFISFLLLVCFFILNMFVGVVVKTFNEVQHAADIKRKKKQREKLKDNPVAARKACKKPSETSKEAAVQLVEAPRWRKILLKFVMHKYFEIAVNLATFLSVLIMACDYYMMPAMFDKVIKIIGYVFLALIASEVVIKCFAFGITAYLKVRWNQLDLAITLLSLTGVALENLFSDNFPVDPSLVRLVRAVRIVRIFKLVRSASGMRRLIRTITDALPRCVNLILLFFLLFFVYASLGLKLYGNFTCNYALCWGLSRHANFNNFGMSMLTLFRIFTGDNWNDVLRDVMAIANDLERCSEGVLSCGTIYAVSPVYFVSFVLLSQFILINVVVAVLMGDLETNALDDNNGVLADATLVAAIGKLDHNFELALARRRIPRLSKNARTLSRENDSFHVEKKSVNGELSLLVERQFSQGFLVLRPNELSHSLSAPNFYFNNQEFSSSLISKNKILARSAVDLPKVLESLEEEYEMVMEDEDKISLIKEDKREAKQSLRKVKKLVRLSALDYHSTDGNVFRAFVELRPQMSHQNALCHDESDDV